MAQDKQADAAKPADPLYDWWFGALPTLLGGWAAPPKHERNGAAHAAAAPFPTGRVFDALKVTQELMENLYGGYFRALIARRPGEELRAFEELVHDRMAGLGDKLAGVGEALSGHPDFKALMPGLAGAAMASITQALKPLSTNIERAYGGLADAFGLAPLRELDAAGRDMAVAALAHRRAQAEYLDVAMVAAGKGLEIMMARLAEMGGRGESVDTMLALVRLWAKTMDEAMHEAMQSPRALQASADLIRASARSRQHQQRIVAIASEALNVPTRAEMDEAYREIQELKRELRRLRKAAVLPSPVSAAPPARKTAAARRKPRGAAVQ
jgi:polyhydroxyalkanoate synthesis regulator phasin